MGKIPAFKRKPVKAVKSDIESAIPRDQWDRPLITPRDGEGKAVAYRRASSVAEALEDHFGLNKWEIRLTCEGLAQRPDLVQSLHGAKNAKEVGAVAKEAFVQAGGGVAARNGQTMHSLTEKLDLGEDLPTGLPSNIIAMLEAYEKGTKRFKPLDTERFVVCDKIKVAGTYDRRLLDTRTGMRLIGDLKTGQQLKYQTLKTPAQVAVYAAGEWYDLDGEREPHGADRDRGLLIHLPWTNDPAEAYCELRWLDLRIGRAAIKEAFRVERFRGMKPDQTLLPVR